MARPCSAQQLAWSSLTHDVLTTVGQLLSPEDWKAARLACKHWASSLRDFLSQIVVRVGAGSAADTATELGHATAAFPLARHLHVITTGRREQMEAALNAAVAAAAALHFTGLTCSAAEFALWQEPTRSKLAYTGLQGECWTLQLPVMCSLTSLVVQHPLATLERPMPSGQLAQLARAATALTRLELRSTPVLPQDLTALSSPQFTALRALCLWLTVEDKDLGDYGELPPASKLLQGLSHLRDLEELTIVGQGVPWHLPHAAQALFPALTQLTFENTVPYESGRADDLETGKWRLTPGGNLVPVEAETTHATGGDMGDPRPSAFDTLVTALLPVQLPPLTVEASDSYVVQLTKLTSEYLPPYVRAADQLVPLTRLRLLEELTICTRFFIYDDDPDDDGDLDLGPLLWGLPRLRTFTFKAWNADETGNIRFLGAGGGRRGNSTRGDDSHRGRGGTWRGRTLPPELSQLTRLDLTCPLARAVADLAALSALRHIRLHDEHGRWREPMMSLLRLSQLPTSVQVLDIKNIMVDVDCALPRLRVLSLSSSSVEAVAMRLPALQRLVFNDCSGDALQKLTRLHTSAVHSVDSMKMLLATPTRSGER